jgi:hypothetical protein
MLIATGGVLDSPQIGPILGVQWDPSGALAESLISTDEESTRI